MGTFVQGQLASINCADLAWRPSTFAKGVFVKDVATCGDVEMQIVRFEPGARFPSHAHVIPEFIYILEGELILAGQCCGPGWASIANQGSTHSDVHSKTGCTFVLVDKAA